MDRAANFDPITAPIWTARTIVLPGHSFLEDWWEWIDSLFPFVQDPSFCSYGPYIPCRCLVNKSMLTMKYNQESVSVSRFSNSPTWMISLGYILKRSFMSRALPQGHLFWIIWTWSIWRHSSFAHFLFVCTLTLSLWVAFTSRSQHELVPAPSH